MKFLNNQPHSHLRGSGCPLCKESKGEEEISKLLKENNIKFIRQHKFDDCRDKSRLPFDFYIPLLNMCIEYDGLQHFKPILYFGGQDKFEKTINRDKIKNDYCEKSGIILIRISYKGKILEKLDFLFNI
jgi:very-short-patch-repair endonuclease